MTKTELVGVIRELAEYTSGLEAMLIHLGIHDSDFGRSRWPDTGNDILDIANGVIREARAITPNAPSRSDANV